VIFIPTLDFDPAALAAPISLPNISTPIFERVLAYGYQQQRQQEEASAQAAKEWNKKFFQVDIIALCELLLAANCLDYKPLLDAASIAIGDLMRGKTPEEIRVEFNIKNDFTPEEEERIARENDWVE
jgi:S-phase kinase-associated protein 1